MTWKIGFLAVAALLAASLFTFSDKLGKVDRVADDGRKLAVQLAELRQQSVPVANRRNKALCDIARVLITERREGQDTSIKVILEPLRAQDPALFDRLVTTARHRTNRLEDDRENLDCRPIPAGPSP